MKTENLTFASLDFQKVEQNTCIAVNVWVQEWKKKPLEKKKALKDQNPQTVSFPAAVFAAVLIVFPGLTIQVFFSDAAGMNGFQPSLAGKSLGCVESTHTLSPL